MRIILATALALVATVNGFSFFGKPKAETSDSMLSLRASIPVAEPQPMQFAAVSNDAYDNYAEEALYCYDKNGDNVLDKEELKKMFQSITDDNVKCEVRKAQVDQRAQLIRPEDQKIIQTWFGN